MLVAGAGAYATPAWGGAFAFGVGGYPSLVDWNTGSANKFSLLVRVLSPLLPVAVLLRLLWTFFLRLHGGTSVPPYFIDSCW